MHQRRTEKWAKDNKYPLTAAKVIADADEAVDGGLLGGGLGWAPWGNQGYHFNRNTIGEDSRLQYKRNHVANAQFWCNKNSEGQEYWDAKGVIHKFETRPETAAEQLGFALHPLQDWVAHGDYGIWDDDNIFVYHNYYSPQDNLYGEVTDFPDDPLLDAINGPDGRPAGLAMHSVLKNLNMSVRLFALYEPGTKRISLTQKLSNELLTEFLLWLKDNGTCECQRYFGLI